jgi:hypothetical protein
MDTQSRTVSTSAELLVKAVQAPREPVAVRGGRYGAASAQPPAPGGRNASAAGILATAER